MRAGQTLTFLFTDIEGSTRLWDRHPDAMGEALRQHDQILRRAIEGHEGVVFKTGGDAFYACFTSVARAIQAATSAQRGLRTAEWGELGPLRVRAAIHSGEAESRDGDYFGQPLNRVARILATCHGGQTLMSQTSRALAGEDLPDDVRLVDLGEHRLRDLERAERLFQVNEADFVEEFPALGSLTAIPNNLPHSTTTFVGRQKEIRETVALLTAQRIVTLVGAGGTGKTRLALQIAAQDLGVGIEGIWLVELAPLENPYLVPGEVARVLGIREVTGKTTTQSIVEHISDRRLLIVLDNCEHVLDATATFADQLLRACPGVRILATSRAPLAISGENVYRVPSLNAPSAGYSRGPEGLAEFDSARLLLDRAVLVQPSFAFTKGNAKAVARVCHQLDGIPLAIELAAARVRAIPIEKIAERLDDRFRLLTGGSRTAMPRQQTLRALIDWSYDLLDEQDRALLTRLSIFQGGWTLEAAEAVCPIPGDDTLTADDVLDRLESLVDKSLVVFNEVDRYRLLESVRQYGQEKLAALGLTEILRDQHLAWFDQFSRLGSGALHGATETEWLEAFDREGDNLRAAMSTSLERPGRAARFFDQIASWLQLRDRFEESMQIANRVLAEDVSPTERVKVVVAVGVAAWRRGDYDVALRFGEMAVALYREIGEVTGLGRALGQLANVRWYLGDRDLARPLYAECLETARQSGDVEYLAVALSNSGLVAAADGDLEVAESYFRESMQSRERRGDVRGRAISVLHLAEVMYKRKDYAAARIHAADAMAGAKQSGSRLSQGYVYHLHGQIELEVDPAAAREWLVESLRIRIDLGERWGVAVTIESLAIQAARTGDPRKAATLWVLANQAREAIHSTRADDERELYERETALLPSGALVEAERATLVLGEAELADLALSLVTSGQTV